MPPQLIAPLVAEEIGVIGGRDVSVFLQDYDQMTLVPLPGRRLVSDKPEPIDGSPAGEAFLRATTVEVPLVDGVRMFLPLLDGSDQVGVLALTLDEVDQDDRRLLSRLAGLVAGMLVAKHGYTDQFFQARRRAKMSVAAEIQWSLLPPLTVSVPQVEVAGILEPVYDVAGDSFDYALNGEVLHAAMIDAMGHGLDAAVMATVAIGAYRHARRAETDLAGKYAFMDSAIANQFEPDHFVTAQMLRLDIITGHLQWVNADHPAPLLIRNHDTVIGLTSETTLPVGLGGGELRISPYQLEPGDLLLLFTDGLIEEHQRRTVRPATTDRHRHAGRTPAQGGAGDGTHALAHPGKGTGRIHPRRRDHLPDRMALRHRRPPRDHRMGRTGQGLIYKSTPATGTERRSRTHWKD